jgi:perosamine synthetase
VTDGTPGGYRIPWARVAFSDREADAVRDAVVSTWVSGGPSVRALEEAFARVLGVPGALTVSNGTVALQLVFRALGIGPGDEIIVPDYAFVAAASQAIWAGATPVLADVREDTWCLDPDSVRENITTKTKAVVAVHTYGNVCELDPLKALCDGGKIALVEDTAESAFSRYRGAYAGTVGDAGTFSFHATKTITTGEGGLVVCRDEAAFQRMELLRSHGMASRGSYWHEMAGSNFRMTNMQAALGLAQMERREEIVRSRGALLATYRALLSGIPGLAVQEFPPHVDPVVWTMGIRVLGPEPRPRRDRLMAAFESQGIEVRPGFHCASEMPATRGPAAVRTGLAVSRMLADSVIALPFYPGLTRADVSAVVAVLRGS